MLVITRKIRENMVIGDDVVVKVLGVNGGQIKLGIEAPESKTIIRTELLNRNKK